MEQDCIGVLKKTLKKWEAAFFETHEKKPTRKDIESAPQRIQDAYREYNKLRKGGTSNENKNGLSQESSSQSEVWGSHLNKSGTPDTVQASGSLHRKGSLLSKFSQKLYQNFNNASKTPRKPKQISTSPESVLHKAPLRTSQIGSGGNESDCLDATSVFGGFQGSQKSSMFKLTSTSVKLQNRDSCGGPATSNILLKSHERRHSWKSDWLEKCKPEVQNKRSRSSGSQLEDQSTHKRDYEVDTVSSEADKIPSEISKVTDANLNENEVSGLPKSEFCNPSKGAKYSLSDSPKLRCSVNSQSVETEARSPQEKPCTASLQTADTEKDQQGVTATQEAGRTRILNSHDNNSKLSKEKGQGKRKRSEETSVSAKRMKESEESSLCDQQHNTPHLSSYEAFEFLEEEEVREQSDLGAHDGVVGDGCEEDFVSEPVVKKKKVKTPSTGSTSTVSGGTTQTRNLNENYVRLNMKYKSYSKGRGPGRLKGSAYKRHMWKQRERGGYRGGKGGGGRGGRGGGSKPWNRSEDTCFKCGGKGHWASQCTGYNSTNNKKKDVEEDWAMKEVGEDEEFPTLEEAALAAAGIKPDKDSAEKAVTAPIVMPPVYEDPTPPPPIDPLFCPDEEGNIIGTPQSVLDALQDMGYSSFRPGQEHTVMRILSGLSTLVVLSTGAGKSLTYQLPAYIYAQRSPCITLVISPLVSLMDDQIFGLPKCLKGARLHSNMTKVQREKVVNEISAGNVSVLLISPEAVVGGGGAGGGCLPPLHKLPPIAFACIDEAHCVSEWSHNFRPSYLMLCRVLRERLGVQCILGLTATATMATANSVAEHLGIAGDPDAIVRGSSVPNNLMLSVSRDPNRERALVELLEGERFRELDSIIIYCIRREETEKVASLLRTCLKADPTRETPVMVVTAEDGVDNDGVKKKGRKKKGTSKKAKRGPVARPPANSAESYHAGMSAAQRRKVQNHFMGGKLRIVVATVAFGMGLDKADVRAVVHYNLPKSFESYVQEIGRAGRDGQPSHCHVFLDPEGSDLCELRRHTYANSMDRVTVKKLVKKVFPPCKCRQLHNLTRQGTEGETESEDQSQNNKLVEVSPSKQGLEEPKYESTTEEEVSKATQHASERLCPGHQVAIPIDVTVQELDIKEESIATLLCYLELHNKRWIRNLPPLYATCNVICYGGPAELRATAKRCPPVAVAIARDQIKGKSYRHSNKVEFNAVEVASSMGWDVVPVKKELRQLQWKQIPGRGWVKSGILVEFSELAMSVRAPGDLTDDDIDEVVEFLAGRIESQEKRELYQLQSVYSALHSVSCKHYAHCCDSVNEASSNHLKELLRQYFQSENASSNRDDVAWEWITPDARQKPEAQEGQVRADVRQFIGLHHDRTFTGRAVARIFHGIPSPCYPAQVWGRDRRFWRRHLDYDFSKLVKIATEEILRMR